MKFTEITCGITDRSLLGGQDNAFTVHALTEADDGSEKGEFEWSILVGNVIEPDMFDSTKTHGMIGLTMNADEVANLYGVTAQEVWDAAERFYSDFGVPKVD